MGFFSYWSKADKALTPKGKDVQNLAEQYQQMSAEQKAKFLSEFFNAKGNKDAKQYLQERLSTVNAASSSQEEGWLTLSQIGDKIGIDKDSFETLDDYFAEIQKEVDDNHKKHGIEKSLGVEKNGSNWRDRYFYKTTGPKIKTETNNSISEMSKAAESSSSSALVRVDEGDAKDEAKEIRQNTKKAAKMLEGLMRLMQAARGLLLQMKASSGQISREIILRLEAAENFWCDFSNKELTSEDFERFCEMAQLHEEDLFSDFPALNPHAPKQLKNIEQEDEEGDDDEASRKKKPKSKAKAKAKAKALGKRKRGVYDEEDDGANEDAPKAKELKQGMEVEDDKEMKDKDDQEGKKEEDNEEEPKDQEGKEDGNKEDEGKEEENKEDEGKEDGDKEDEGKEGKEGNDKEDEPKDQEGKDKEEEPKGQEGKELKDKEEEPKDKEEEPKDKDGQPGESKDMEGPKGTAPDEDSDSDDEDDVDKAFSSLQTQMEK